MAGMWIFCFYLGDISLNNDFDLLRICKNNDSYCSVLIYFNSLFV